MRGQIFAFMAAAAAVIFASCSGGKGSHYADMPGDTLTSRARLLTLVDKGDFVEAVIADPWNDGRKLASYALVDRNKPAPEGIEKEYTVVNVPLQRSIVYSSTNSAAIDELGALHAIAAVADGNYYTPGDTVAKLIASGRITDIGNSMSPKPETIVDVDPDAILVSPYENAGHGVLDELGVTVIDCADYMEADPLSRAEWLLFLGELYGDRELARSIYNQVVTDYETLRHQVSEATSAKPKVLTEVLTSGVWYVPGGNSYMARMLNDAGADYPWSDDSSTGSLQLGIEAVIDKASDADIWLARYYGDLSNKTKMLDISPLNANFKAYQNGEIYNCNPLEKPIFNDVAFHPERVLLDFIIIFHPELFPGLETCYYTKVADK